jgi:SAM-dependent methyltransferase
VDSRERFSAAAAAYEQNRPGYPGELVDWIAATSGAAPPARVADVGCGTGIASRMLAARGYDVIGVEPNAAMRERAIAAGGGARYQAGEAVATGLPDGAVELVIAAQAFHYFPIEPTMREWRRILAVGGGCAVFWYRIAASPIRADYRALRDRHTAPDRRGGRAIHKRDIAAAVVARPEAAGVQVARFLSTQRLDRAGLLGRFAASSYLGAGTSALVDEVDALFDRHQRGGAVELPLETTAVAWRFAPH